MNSIDRKTEDINNSVSRNKVTIRKNENRLTRVENVSMNNAITKI